MTTPRIEEMVEETMEDISEHIYVEPMSLGQARDYEKARWIEALTQARQAGINESVELVNKHDPMANKKSNPNYWGNTLRKDLKALQDNK